MLIFVDSFEIFIQLNYEFDLNIITACLQLHFPFVYLYRETMRLLTIANKRGCLFELHKFWLFVLNRVKLVHMLYMGRNMYMFNYFITPEL